MTLTATPAAGNQFAGWTGDASGADQPDHDHDARQHHRDRRISCRRGPAARPILREYWLNVTRHDHQQPDAQCDLPDSPTGSEMLTSLEGATNIADNYGARIRGYVHPLITGAVHLLVRQRRRRRPAAEHQRQSGQRHAHRVRGRTGPTRASGPSTPAAVGGDQPRPPGRSTTSRCCTKKPPAAITSPWPGKARASRRR